MKARALQPDGVLYANATPMVGKKYGHLTVLEEAGRRDYGLARTTGWRLRLRLVRVRCDCGRQYVALASAVRNVLRRCKECGQEYTRRHGRDVQSVRLANGKTVAQIAETSGVSLNTVYVRWMRGWPDRHLGKPIGFRRD